MAFPVLEASNNGEVSTNSTSSTINLPSGITAGEVLAVYFSLDGTTSTIAVDTGYSGSNWNIVQYTGGSSCKIAVVWKVAEGGDALRLTHNSEQSTHISDRFSGANTVEVSSGNTGATSNANSFNLDLAGGVAKDVHWVSFAGMDGIGSASVAPTSYTNLRNKTATNSTGASSFVAERQLNASGENPLAFTNTAQRWQIVTIAIYQDGLPGRNATLAANDEDDVLTASGDVAVGATLSATDEDDVLTSAGDTAIEAALSATDEDDVLTGAGVTAIDATLAATDQDDVLSAAATVRVSASLSHTDEDDVLTATAEHEEPGELPGRTATLSSVDEDDVLTASAHVAPLPGEPEEEADFYDAPDLLRRRNVKRHNEELMQLASIFLRIAA